MAEGDTLLAYLHPNDVSASFHQSIMDLIGYDLGHNHRIGDLIHVRCATGGVPEGRNQAAAYLLSHPEFEWLWFIDADMGFAPNTVDMLHASADARDRPTVGGLAFAQREMSPDGMGGFRCKAYPTIFDWIEHDDGLKRFTGRRYYPVNSLIQCDATGAACLLIHRSVFERIAADWGPTWFDRTLGSDKSLLGEDISFFLRCGSVGIPCYVHTGVRTTHHKGMWLAESDFWDQFIPDPATEHVDVIVPVLHRPQNIAPFMQSLRASTGLATARFVVEPGDTEVIDEVARNGAVWQEHAGSFAQKVNAAYPNTEAPWVFLVGDDVRFHAGWLDHALHTANNAYGGDVIGTNDLGNPRVTAGAHATHMLIRRSYIDEVGASWDGPGVVAHEGYRHWFVDDEIVNAAQQRGVWQMSLGSIVEHLHPIFGKADDDDVYRLGQSFSAKDQAIFEARASKYLRAA